MNECRLYYTVLFYSNAHIVIFYELSYELSTPVLLNSFGYVVEGSDFLQDIKEGDVITSAKVTDGLEYLVQPKD
jgi:cyclophilin family peptidyl-prolyl cis-trans isomerase